MRAAAERDYYAVLGVSETAAEEEIKRAYRRLALRHHPDRNRGDKQAEERFKALSEAYAVLMDPARRRDYDRARHARAAGRPGEEPGWRPGWRPDWREEDLFRDLFTDPRTASVFDDLGREWSRMGLRFNEAFLRDLFFGGRAVIIVTPGGIRWIGTTGPRAGVERIGTAAPPGPEPAFPRGGILAWLWGRATAALAGPLLALRRALALPDRGARRGDLTYEIWLTRAELAGGGRYRLTIERAGRTEELLVRVPPGLRPDARLRLRGKGEPGSDGRPGDLYLRARPKG